MSHKHIIVIAAIALSACQTGREGPSTTDTAETEHAVSTKDVMTSPLATTGHLQSGTVKGESYALARFFGKLALRNGCLVVETTDGNAVQPVFGHAQATWNSDSQQLTYNGRVYRLGEAITVNGGVLPFKRNALPNGWSVPDCGDVELFGVS